MKKEKEYITDYIPRKKRTNKKELEYEIYIQLLCKLPPDHRVKDESS